jgi:hypothetical protein
MLLAFCCVLCVLNLSVLAALRCSERRAAIGFRFEVEQRFARDARVAGNCHCVSTGLAEFFAMFHLSPQTGGLLDCITLLREAIVILIVHFSAPCLPTLG